MKSTRILASLFLLMSINPLFAEGYGVKSGVKATAEPHIYSNRSETRKKLQIRSSDCHELVAHHPNADVVFDLRHESHLPADINGTSGYGMADSLLDLDLLLRADPDRERKLYSGHAARVGAEAMIAHVELREGRVFINGYLAEDDEPQRIKDACLASLKRK